MKKMILILSLLLLLSTCFATDASACAVFAGQAAALPRIKGCTGTVEFSKSSYAGLQSVASVTVEDRDLNLRLAYRDVARITITSESDPKGFMLLIYETGANTGVFSGNVNFSSKDTNGSVGQIRVNGTDNIAASYIDERNADGEADVIITDIASFTFTEAKIKTSATDDEGMGNMLEISITEPDANNPRVKDRLIAKAGAGSSTDDLTLWLEETGRNTDIFRTKLYLNDELGSFGTLHIAPSDNINIKYVDDTVPEGGMKEIVKTVKWTYLSTVLELDREAYTGYNSSAKVTLINKGLNKNADKIEYVDVKVRTSSSDSIKLELKEVSADSGEFSGTLCFGKSSSSSDGMIEVANNDTIFVSYIDKKNNDDLYECSAVWSPQNGDISLDREEYRGDGAPVRITVKDSDMSKNNDERNKIKVKATIQGSNEGTTISLEETSRNSGIFKGILYINGSDGEKPSISLSPKDVITIEYEDKDTTSGSTESRKAYASWSGNSEAYIKFDKTVYKGYDSYMTINLDDPDQNKSTTTRDKVDIMVCTKNGKTNMEYTLTETGFSTGIFSARLKLVKTASTDGKVRVAAEDEITVVFKKKNVSAVAGFVER